MRSGDGDMFAFCLFERIYKKKEGDLKSFVTVTWVTLNKLSKSVRNMRMT